MKFCYIPLRTVSVWLLCIGSVLSVSAQRKAPGYMGKRFLLKYDQGISWSLGGDARGIPNLFYTLQGDLAITTKWSVGAEYSFMTRKYEKKLGQPGGYWANANERYYRLDRTYAHRVGIYAKMFSQRNGHIAPAGPYFSMGMNLFFVQGYYSRFNTQSYTGNKSREQKLSIDFGPTIGGGKQYVIANRMVISVDLRITLPLIGMARSFNSAAEIENPAKVQQNSLDRWTLWPNTQANFIELRVGLGTLL